MEIDSGQRRFLKARAHALKPSVQIGHAGITEGVLDAVQDALEAHELIKIRFGDHKADKDALSGRIADRTGSILVGSVGHVSILYRQHPDPDRRRLDLPASRRTP